MNATATGPAAAITAHSPAVTKIKSSSARSETLTLEWEIEDFIPKNFAADSHLKCAPVVFKDGRKCWLEVVPNQADETKKGKIAMFAYASMTATYEVSVTMYRLGLSGEKTLLAGPYSFSNTITGGAGRGWESFVSETILANGLLPGTARTVLFVAAIRSFSPPGDGMLALPAAKPLSTPVPALQEQLSDTLANIEEDGPGVVKLAVNGKHILAHMVILTSRSSVFRAMFNAGMTEKKRKAVHISDVEDVILQEMVNCMYTDQCNPDILRDRVFELLAVADKYDFPFLLRTCENQILSTVTCENVLDGLIAAHTHNRIELKNSLLEFVTENMETIELTSKYEDLCDNHPTVAVDILKFRTSKTKAAHSGTPETQQGVKRRRIVA